MAAPSGVDVCPVAVANLERVTVFYRDALGFTVTGWGRTPAVEGGAQTLLDITALHRPLRLPSTVAFPPAFST